ncbi:MAG: DUF4180 domain-containing protein [Candidatus Nealsonbacteria bacterium DGGOD1a]|jgi:hypothetical protein|nr:MAG: DUF4180 domain-containing protein [Candidatus Nealsonbacteria bacterium DGGOD1a]
MKIIIYEKCGDKIGQAASDEIIVNNERDALDLMVDPRLRGARKIIIGRKNIIPGFFDLSTRIAGEILQKFVTYQVKLAIVGDFSDASPTLKDFIYESNRGTQIFFVDDIETAKNKLFAAK